MRRLLLLFVCLLLMAPARAQQPRLKLDALGLPPFPGGTSAGHISLPLAAVLAPKEGEKPTGPALTDLSIATYRTPLSVPVPQIAAFYRKYATEAGWRLLDDIPESADKRSLVFWSPAAPGYLTVDITFSPDNSQRQIDLTRLLGDVNPDRPGEALKLTGKRIRRQQVSATFTGRFLDIATNKFVRTTLPAVEETSESGLAGKDARWIAPVAEAYDVSLEVTDASGAMTRAQVYANNGDKVAEAVSPEPTERLRLTARVRASQGLSMRVLILGVAPPTTEPEPAGPPVPPLLAPLHVPPPDAGRDPYREIILSEWPGVRPPRTALIELRRGAVSTQMTPIKLKEEDLGPSCDGALSKTITWTGRTTDAFTFSPDLFGPGFPRAQVGLREGTVKVDFPKGSGLSNVYILNQNQTATETSVQLGYSYGGEWLALPSKRKNPETTAYVTTMVSPPTVTRRTAGKCDEGSEGSGA